MSTALLPGAAVKLRRLGHTVHDIGRYTGRASVDVDKIPVPANSEELADMIADDARVAQIMADRGTLTAWIDRYAAKQQGPGTDLNRLVAAETQKQLAQLLRDKDVDDEGAERIRRLNLDPQARPTNMLTSHKQATAYNAKAPGAYLDKEFGSGAEFFQAVWHLNQSADVQGKMARLRNAAASSTVPADGGFLVPEILRSQLLQMALEMSITRARATVVPMDSARVPFPAIDVTSHASSVFGGMIGYWTEESAQLTDTAAAFRRVVLDAKKLTGFSLVPNELMQDSIISFAALIESMWPRALAFFEDVAFMTGGGVDRPLGWIGSQNTAAVAQAIESGQQASTVVLQNIVKMYSRMLPASHANAAWFCAPDVLPQLFTMALSVGTGGGPVMLTNAAGPAPMTILGRPLIVSEKCQPLGTRGDIVYADLSYYLIGDRQAMSAATSTDYRFQNDETAYRLIQRVDGRPWVVSALTPQNSSSNTLSPFVELAAR